MENQPKHVIFYSQDEWPQGYNNKSPKLAGESFVSTKRPKKSESLILLSQNEGGHGWGGSAIIFIKNK